MTMQSSLARGWEGSHSASVLPGALRTQHGFAEKFAEALLESHGRLSTFNRHRARVLPKRHTSPIGMTLRGLSANLAFTRSAIDVNWSYGARFRPPLDHLSILLLPRPLQVEERDFRRVRLKGGSAEVEGYAYFAFDRSWRRRQDEDVDKYLDKALAEASSRRRSVDLVVLPECAVDHETL